MKQKTFRIELGQTMYNTGKANTSKRSRPPSTEKTNGKIKKSAAPIPPNVFGEIKQVSGPHILRDKVLKYHMYRKVIL